MGGAEVILFLFLLTIVIILKRYRNYGSVPIKQVSTEEQPLTPIQKHLQIEKGSHKLEPIDERPADEELFSSIRQRKVALAPYIAAQASSHDEEVEGPSVGELICV